MTLSIGVWNYSDVVVLFCFSLYFNFC